MKYLLMLVLLFSFNQVKALAVYATGNDLLELCEINQEMAPSCIFYVMGVADFHNQAVEWGYLEPIWCVPGGATPKQLARIVTKRMQEHPDELHVSAAKQVEAALYHAFPCE